jgi:SnoaL-like domain
MTELLSAAHPTTERYRRAGEAGDVEGLLATLAPDVVLHSPITERVVFRGHEEMRELLRAVFSTVTDVQYFADVGDERTRVLFDHVRVNGRAMEQAHRVTLHERGEIDEITLFFRPLPGLARLTYALGPRIAEARHGPVRGLIARLLLAPLALFTSLGDRLITLFS